mmetsp:Transcript_59978/g.95244  ORF Transcript_59978/g.95244 Transcript_59978/m.95244 type:complete len:215 (-) Transcript_59978:26-670(-)
MKDRLAAHAASLARERGERVTSTGVSMNRGLEPSGPCEGWDKYYFFSVPAGGTHFPPTAMLGRRRPAAHGPQTFCSEAFSKEVIARERGRIEKRGPRTTYAEFHSQFPRSSTAQKGLPKYEGQKFSATKHDATSPGVLMRAASDTLLQARAPAATGDVRPRERMGPHWPPKTEMRPDSLSTRKQLFPDGHLTFVDLFSADRPAPRGHGYTVHVG